jgi:hypothetical protein
MMPLTPSEVIRRSAAAVAAPASIQVESARTGDTVDPPKRAPLAFTSAIANSAPSPIAGVIASSGPVKPNITPILMSSADANPAVRATAVVAKSNFLILFSLLEHLSENNDRRARNKKEANFT